MSLDLFRSLPNEMQVFIFSYLSRADFARCSQVCSRWNCIANDEELWQRIAAKIFTAGALQVPCVKQFLRQWTYQNLRSNDELVWRIEDFLERVVAGQRAKFICFLGGGFDYQTVSLEILPEHLITREAIGLTFSDWQINNFEFDLEEHYFSSKPISEDDDLMRQVSSYTPCHRVYCFSIQHESEKIYYSYANSHKVFYRIPCDLGGSALQRRIDNLIKQRLDQLEEDSRKWKCTLCNQLCTLGAGARRLCGQIITLFSHTTSFCKIWSVAGSNR